MKKVVAIVVSALVLVPVAFGGNGTANYGGIKVGTCKAKTFVLDTSNVDEYQVGSNAVLVSVSGANVTVSLCATTKGKFGSELQLKNSGNVLTSLALVGNGV